MNDKNKKEQGNSKWLGIVLFLMFTQPMLFIPLAVFGLIIYLTVKAVIKQQGTPVQSRQEKFDDCPQPLFCFHKDKGEHHVRRGKEIDPWDRPDIDISKYQRRQ